MKILGEIQKTLAAVGVLIGVVSAALADGHVTATEAGAIAVAAIGVVAVFSLKNATRVEDVVADAQKFGLLPAAVPTVTTPEGVTGAYPASPPSPAEDEVDDQLDLDDAPRIEVGDASQAPASRAN